MTDKSRAWKMGRAAALECSHRKPPKTASQKWQDEYWQGWEAGRTEAQAAHAALVEKYPGLAGDSTPKGRT